MEALRRVWRALAYLASPLPPVRLAAVGEDGGLLVAYLLAAGGVEVLRVSAGGEPCGLLDAGNGRYAAVCRRRGVLTLIYKTPLGGYAAEAIPIPAHIPDAVQSS